MAACTFAFSKKGTYYKRHRALSLLSSNESGHEVIGHEVDALITRYGAQSSRYYRPFDAYYHNGIFYRIVSHPVSFYKDGEPKDYAHVFAPINNALLSDRYAAHTRAKGDAIPNALIHVVDGTAVEVKTRECGVVYTQDDGLDYLEELLGLKATKRKSPRKVA